MQDLGVVLYSLLRALLGPLYVFYQLVQHVYEDLLHFLNCLYHISDALQEAILHGKYSGITKDISLLLLMRIADVYSFYFRLMILWATISLT